MCSCSPAPSPRFALAGCLITLTLRVRVISFVLVFFFVTAIWEINKCFCCLFLFMVFEELWGLWTTMTISPPVWWRGVHIVKIPWINYCAHSFSYLVMSAVMTSVSGIWDGYFFNVNFPEIFLCLQAVVFFCKPCDQINLTLWRLAGHLTRLRRTSCRISPDWRRQRGSFFIPDGAFDELCTVKTCD